MAKTADPNFRKGHNLATGLIQRAGGGAEAAKRVKAAFDKIERSYRGESVIEAVFYCSLIGYFEVLSDQPIEAPREQFVFGSIAVPGGICVWQQAIVDRYRVDFLISGKTANGDDVFVVVECDGHDFHERTKAQAARDKSRDRKLQSLGLPVLRFTGSEIWADANGCAEEVHNFLIERIGS